MAPETSSVRYSSTRWHDPSAQRSYSFEDVVLKGLASDGGLFHPEDIPDVRASYMRWKDLSFSDLAFQVLRPYISETEIADEDLRLILDRSYSVFRHPSTVPLRCLDPTKNLYLLELFHGPTFAFKDVALQFLGNLFEFFLVRRNRDLRPGQPRHHLTVIGATSGDTGSAAIYGLRGKKDLSIFIMFPDGKVSPVQEAQMTTVLDANVHNLSIKGTFDDCQDTVKALFADAEMNESHRLAAVNSINWARILAQITYYFYAYFQLLEQTPNLSDDDVQFVVPTGNFGDVLAGFYAKRMGLPIAKLVIATNENDILHRFWQSGTYSKQHTPPAEVPGGFAQDGAKAHEGGVKETLSPAMDILVSSNFERLLWQMNYDHELAGNSDSCNGSLQPSSGSTADHNLAAQRAAGEKISSWFASLKATGSFTVSQPEILTAARLIFTTHRVSDAEITSIIRGAYRSEIFSTATTTSNYVLDPHSAVGIAAALRQISSDQSDTDTGSTVQAGTPEEAEKKPESRKKRVHLISLATAHPAKFASAVQASLGQEPGFDFEATVSPPQFRDLDSRPRRLRKVDPHTGLEGIKHVIRTEIEGEKLDGLRGL